MGTYARVGFCQAFEDADVEGVDSRASNFLLVLVEPQIMSSVALKVELLSIKIVVVHIYFEL